MALKLAIIRTHDGGELEPVILLEESLYDLLVPQFSFRAEAKARKLAEACETAVKAKSATLP